MTQGNPATLSPRLATLLPQGVVAAELCETADPALLLPEEAACCRADGKRLLEFTAGRLCARKALSRLGITGFPIRVNTDRTPIWPKGVVGSITHTNGFCGAVVAPQAHYAAIGLDAEVIRHVTSDVWPQLCTPDEAARLRAMPPLARANRAALIFSAKEALYKCQYAVTREWLEFQDVVIDSIVADGTCTGRSFAAHGGAADDKRAIRHGVFSATLPGKDVPWGAMDIPISGRFLYQGDLVITAVVLEAHQIHRRAPLELQNSSDGYGTVARLPLS